MLPKMEILNKFISSIAITGIAINNYLQGVQWNFTDNSTYCVKDGINNGYVRRYLAGMLYYEIHLLGDTYHGKETCWYYNGNINYEYNYLNHQRHGWQIERLQDGTLTYLALYRYNKHIGNSYHRVSEF